MKSFFIACAVCGSLDAEPLFPSFFRAQHSLAQMIVICRRCGLVYRNPHIPDLCVEHYGDVGSWDGESIYIERLRGVAERIRSHVQLGTGDCYLEVGCGPGWLAEHMASIYPDSRAVLLEPSPAVANHAQRRNPAAAVLPAVLEEATLPQGAFSCAIACGVDYLFQDHRKDIERIHGLLRPGGVFYIERNVFLDQRSLTKRPIFDIEDLFGLNHRMNTWFGREQFAEYLSEFFDILDVYEYVSDVSPPPYDRKNVVTGVFGRKRPNGERRPQEAKNRYREHLGLLRAMAEDSSLEDLRILAKDGIRRVAICGIGPEARFLAAMIRDHNVFSIAAFASLSNAASQPERDRLAKEFASGDASQSIDAYLIASVAEQETFVAALKANGQTNGLRCFRPGLPAAWDDSGTLQLKAFLPAHLRAS